MSMYTEILNAIKAKIETLPWPVTVSWEKIRLTATDFAEHEIPVVQFYVPRIDSEHQVQTLESRMSVFVEVVLKQSFTNTINASTLWDYIEDIKDVIGQNANLGVPKVIHCRMVSRQTDLHTIEPYYYGLIEFEVIFKEAYTRICS